MHPRKNVMAGKYRSPEQRHIGDFCRATGIKDACYLCVDLSVGLSLGSRNKRHKDNGKMIQESYQEESSNSRGLG